jgi:hypothetical protein
LLQKIEKKNSHTKFTKDWSGYIIELCFNRFLLLIYRHFSFEASYHSTNITGIGSWFNFRS